jgi:hypothetical protein
MSGCRRQVIAVPSTFFDIVPVGKNNDREVIMRRYSGIRCGADRKVFLILLGKSTNARDSTLLLDVAGQGCSGSDCDVGSLRGAGAGAALGPEVIVQWAVAERVVHLAGVIYEYR